MDFSHLFQSTLGYCPKVYNWRIINQLKRLARQQFSNCHLCLRTTLGSAICDACVTDLPQCPTGVVKIAAVDHCVIPYRYEYPLDRLLYRVKQRNDFALLNALSALFRDTCGPPPQQAVIVPVPSDIVSISKRGFNQAAVFAERLATLGGQRVDYDSVGMHWHNRPQKSLGAKQRHQNARDTFYIRRKGSFSTVVIVDDVVTTGATAARIARLLRANGATKVLVYALAAKL